MERFIGALAFIALVVVLTAAPASAAASPGVIPPFATPFGQSYGMWSAAWWRWAFQTPVHGPNGQLNPLVVGSGPIDCSYGQSGKVWFLAGTFVSSVSNGVTISQVSRSCTIPAGTALMFPTLNSEFDNVVCAGPPTTFTVEQMQAFTKAAQGTANSMFAIIDGAPVADIAGPNTPYRVTSPVFQYVIPSDNLFSTSFVCGVPVPAGPIPKPGAVADGVYVMLTPLAPERMSSTGGPRDPVRQQQADVSAGHYVHHHSHWVVPQREKPRGRTRQGSLTRTNPPDAPAHLARQHEQPLLVSRASCALAVLAFRTHANDPAKCPIERWRDLARAALPATDGHDVSARPTRTLGRAVASS